MDLKKCTENGHHARYARDNKHLSLRRPLRESYQRLIFHNSQPTFPSVVVRNPAETATFCIRLALIICLKCIIICYYVPIVRYSSFFAMLRPICRRINVERHLFCSKDNFTRVLFRDLRINVGKG